MKHSSFTEKNALTGVANATDVTPVRGKRLNDLIDDFDAHITADGNMKANIIAEYTTGTGVTVDGVLCKDDQVEALALGNAANTGQILCVETALTAAEIVGTSAGDIGHAAGAILVAAPGAGYVLEFISAVLIYDYDTAAYTGGGDDNVIQNGSTATAFSAAIAGADLLEAAGDKMIQVNALAATDQVLVENMAISFKGTALTQPGTAAGVLRAHVSYRVHTTGLA